MPFAPHSGQDSRDRVETRNKGLRAKGLYTGRLRKAEQQQESQSKLKTLKEKRRTLHKSSQVMEQKATIAARGELGGGQQVKRVDKK